MNLENAWTRRAEAQKIEIQELEQKGKELVIQLHDAEEQVASLKVEVARLENGNLELTIKLQDAAAEVARLSMQVKHQVVPPDRRQPARQKD